MKTKSTTYVPHVRILLATHNGASWLDEQLDSISTQQDVRVTIIASDDRSSDGTVSTLTRWANRITLDMLPLSHKRFGSAHRNFLRLIRDTELGDADYFALSDQDDIWLPGKLLRGIYCLRSQNAQGYSSNVTAFWPDGRKKRIDKAHPLQSLDHLFSAPGPGCTFVIPRAVFIGLQAFVVENFDRLQTIWVHDWLIYAFVRAQGGKWHIDPQSNMLYRQHGNNEIGVNYGWRAALSRLKRVRSGAYRRDILAIADSVGESDYIVEALRRFRFIDRLSLILNVRRFRRRYTECVYLAFLFLIMPSS
ncbi:MAG: glycosyltransferase [Dethiobacter sp.]|nr:glycosyltransferase [Dethiobacter sp.]